MDGRIVHRHTEQMKECLVSDREVDMHTSDDLDMSSGYTSSGPRTESRTVVMEPAVTEHADDSRVVPHSVLEWRHTTLLFILFLLCGVV